MHEFKIEVTREGRWWMVRIPEIGGVTQARRLAEGETMAREYIALAEGLPFNEVKVATSSVRMVEPAFRELLDDAREINALKERARHLEEQVNEMVREYCHWLTTYGVPVRDIAELLDISPQRVSQLANS